MSKSRLIKFQEKVIGDVRTLIVQKSFAYVIVELIVFVGIYHSAKDSVMAIIKRPTPIWVTIVVGLAVLLLYVRLKKRIDSFKKNKVELKKYFGLLWDDDLNAHCPSCKNLLPNYAYYSYSRGKSVPGFKCITCDAILFMSDETQIHITLDDAKVKIIQKST